MALKASPISIERSEAFSVAAVIGTFLTAPSNTVKIKSGQRECFNIDDIYQIVRDSMLLNGDIAGDATKLKDVGL